MDTVQFTHELEMALRAEQAAIRRDAVATLARIIRQKGPPSDRALATLWLYHLANQDSDERVRTMAAVPIRLTTVWSEGLKDKLNAPEYKARIDAVYTLREIMLSGSEVHAHAAHQWLEWVTTGDAHQTVRATAAQALGMPVKPEEVSRWTLPVGWHGEIQFRESTYKLWILAAAGRPCAALVFALGVSRSDRLIGIIGLPALFLGCIALYKGLGGRSVKRFVLHKDDVWRNRKATYYGSAAVTISNIFIIHGIILLVLGLGMAFSSSTILAVLWAALVCVMFAGYAAIAIATEIIKHRQQGLNKRKKVMRKVRPRRTPDVGSG